MSDDDSLAVVDFILVNFGYVSQLDTRRCCICESIILEAAGVSDDLVAKRKDVVNASNENVLRTNNNTSNKTWVWSEYVIGQWLFESTGPVYVWQDVLVLAKEANSRMMDGEMDDGWWMGREKYPERRTKDRMDCDVNVTRDAVNGEYWTTTLEHETKHNGILIQHSDFDNFTQPIQ